MPRVSFETTSQMSGTAKSCHERGGGIKQNLHFVKITDYTNDKRYQRFLSRPSKHIIEIQHLAWEV